MARQSVYFTALKAHHKENGNPVSIGDVPCIFRKGKHYAVDARNEKLVAAITEGVKSGGFKLLTEEEALPLLKQQGVADHLRRVEGKSRPAGVIPPGDLTAKVE